MRAVAILTALLMLLGPLAAAEGGAGSSSSGSDSGSSSAPSSDSNSTSEGPGGNSTSDGSNSTAPPPPEPVRCPMPERKPATEEEVQACKERFCAEHPRERICREERADQEDQAADNASAERGPREWQRWCRGE